MNLQNLSSPLPKPWLSIKANDIEVNTIISKVDISNGPVSLVFTSPLTLNITPENLVNGILGCFSDPGIILQFPTAAAINTYLASLPQDSASYLHKRFTFLLCVSGGLVSTEVNVLFNPTGGVSAFNGNANIDIVTTTMNIQHSFTFVQGFSSTQWIVYY